MLSVDTSVYLLKAFSFTNVSLISSVTICIQMLVNKLTISWEFDRCNNIVTDAVKDITHVNHALSKCGYPKWAFKKVMQQLDQKAAEE